MLSSHPQEICARQTSGDLSEKLVSTPRFPQQIDEWQSLHEQFVCFKFESSAPQNKLSSHDISLKGLEEKYDEVYTPSNGISPGNSDEKFDEEPYRSFSLPAISVHESAGTYLSRKKIPDKSYQLSEWLSFQGSRLKSESAYSWASYKVPPSWALNKIVLQSWALNKTHPFSSGILDKKKPRPV